MKSFVLRIFMVLGVFFSPYPEITRDSLFIGSAIAQRVNRYKPSVDPLFEGLPTLKKSWSPNLIKSSHLFPDQTLRSEDGGTIYLQAGDFLWREGVVRWVDPQGKKSQIEKSENI